MEIRFDERGLVPVVIQDWASGEVLTLAYANAEAIDRTRETGELHLWSRSRDELWHKGATSGNVQKVRALRLDCDGDAVLALVEPAGPACHTGRADVLPQRGRRRHARRTRRCPSSSARSSRASASARTGSYTVTAARRSAAHRREGHGGGGGGRSRAAREETDDRVDKEAADVLYHLTVLLRSRDRDLADAEEVLLGRRR